MNIELTTATDDSAEVREMISSWTDALLRLRSRPARASQRGEWQFTVATAREMNRNSAWPTAGSAS